jgi:hypothetical protein
VVEKDEIAARHFIGVVAAINYQSASELRLLISDGHYALWSALIRQGDIETSDGMIFSLCQSGRIKVGIKLHLVN